MSYVALHECNNIFQRTSWLKDFGDANFLEFRDVIVGDYATGDDQNIFQALHLY